jgi:hypothetical protein
MTEYLLGSFVKNFDNLSKNEKNRINSELREMGAELLVQMLVDVAYRMVIYEREYTKEKWPKNAERYRKLIARVIEKANNKLAAGKNRIK